MKHRIKKTKLGRSKSHKDAMFSNLLVSLIEHKKIKTTVAKAKELSRLADKMITLAKKGDLHSFRLALAKLRGNKEVAFLLFNDLVKCFKDRHSGYTRIIRLGNARGDNREWCFIEYLSADEGTMKDSTEKNLITETVKLD